MLDRYFHSDFSIWWKFQAVVCSVLLLPLWWLLLSFGLAFELMSDAAADVAERKFCKIEREWGGWEVPAIECSHTCVENEPNTHKSTGEKILCERKMKMTTKKKRKKEIKKKTKTTKCIAISFGCTKLCKRQQQQLRETYHLTQKVQIIIVVARCSRCSRFATTGSGFTTSRCRWNVMQ